MTGKWPSSGRAGVEAAGVGGVRRAQEGVWCEGTLLVSAFCFFGMALPPFFFVCGGVRLLELEHAPYELTGISMRIVLHIEDGALALSFAPRGLACLCGRGPRGADGTADSPRAGRCGDDGDVDGGDDGDDDVRR